MRTKNNKIWIYSKAPFDNSYSNVIKFDSQDQMDGFFENSTLLNEIYSSDTYSWIKRNGAINVKGNISIYETASYMRFLNEEGRMYYAFIIDTEYPNADTTTIYFEIDVYNTYQIELKNESVQGFVEQCTMKNFKNGLRNIVNVDQGFNTGTLVPEEIYNLGMTIDWLVVVAKPTIQMSNNDLRTGLPDLPGTYKSFRYFVIPVNLSRGITYQTSINGTIIKSTSIQGLLRSITNSFIDTTGVNTVNQIVSIYTTKYCGIDYEISGNTVIVSDFGRGAVQVVGGENISIDGSEDSGISQGNVDSAVNWDVDITYNGQTLTASFIKRMILWCRAFQLYPEMLLPQMWLESNWGNSNVGQVDNNWSGITAWSSLVSQGTESIPAVGITVTLGTQRPSGEGGYYVHFDSVEDWLAYHIYLISGFPANSGDKRYKTAGIADTQTALQGLFRKYGAEADYASTDADVYVATCMSILATMRGQFGDVIDAIIALVYNGSNWLTSDPEINNQGLDTLQANLGAYVGNRECYAVASLYSSVLDGPSLEAGISRPGMNWKEGSFPDADTVSAGSIGDAYDWQAYNFSVEFEPISFDQLRVGDIICWKPHSTYSNSQWGHVAVIYNVDYDNNLISFYDQFRTSGGIRDKSNVTAALSSIRSIIHAPGSHQYNGSGGSSGNVVNPGYSAYAMIEVISASFTQKKISLGKNLYEALERIINTRLSGENQIESQLFTSEFCNFRMFDAYGNAFEFKPEWTPNGETIINVTGCVGDSNHIHYTIDKYNLNTTTGSSVFDDIQKIYYGMIDSFPRNLTIISDATETFMQANNNNYQAQMQSFNENSDILNKQVNLNTRETLQANREATYNSDYAITTSRLNYGQTATNSLIGPATQFLNGNVGGGVNAYVNGIWNLAGAQNNLNNAVQQGEFTSDRNSLRTESNSLANMQAKLALNQSIRAYNASIKDLDAAPASIVQFGNDLSFQGGNGRDDIYISIEVPDITILENANRYIRNFGVTFNGWVNDIKSITQNRKYFNYIKCAEIDIKNIFMNQSHLNAFKAVFISGVRIWNYNNDIDNMFMNMNIINEDL